MTEEFLRGLEVNSCRSQVGCQRVTETVPADHLVRDSGSNESRTDDFLEHPIAREGLSTSADIPSGITFGFSVRCDLCRSKAAAA